MCKVSYYLVQAKCPYYLVLCLQSECMCKVIQGARTGCNPEERRGHCMPTPCCPPVQQRKGGQHCIRSTTNTEFAYEALNNTEYMQIVRIIAKCSNCDAALISCSTRPRDSLDQAEVILITTPSDSAAHDGRGGREGSGRTCREWGVQGVRRAKWVPGELRYHVQSRGYRGLDVYPLSHVESRVYRGFDGQSGPAW